MKSRRAVEHQVFWREFCVETSVFSTRHEAGQVVEKTIRERWLCSLASEVCSIRPLFCSWKIADRNSRVGAKRKTHSNCTIFSTPARMTTFQKYCERSLNYRDPRLFIHGVSGNSKALYVAYDSVSIINNSVQKYMRSLTLIVAKMPRSDMQS